MNNLQEKIKKFSDKISKIETEMNTNSSNSDKMKKLGKDYNKTKALLELYKKLNSLTTALKDAKKTLESNDEEILFRVRTSVSIAISILSVTKG